VTSVDDNATSELVTEHTLDVERTEAAKPLQRVLRRIWRPVLGLAIAAAISVLVFRLSGRVEQFGLYGYPGVFVISLLGNATVILPAPSLAVVSVAGSVLNPYLVGLFAGAGSALGELTGYLAGYSGRAVIADRGRYDQILAWMQRYGLWVIFVLSVIPNPLFDLAGIAAGALKVPVHQFLLVCWLGKTVKTTAFALGGDALSASFLYR
jgi:membrane protein YqaA with SNARE-associated domain